MLARGREREGGGDGDDARAAARELAVELGEAQVVTDAQAQLDAAGGARDDDLVARLVGVGLAVAGPADLDVEHVDLAVGRARLAVGAEVHGGVADAVGALDVLGDRAGDEVDAELARGVTRPRQRGAVERLGAGGGLLGAREHGPFLGQDDEIRARRGGGARESVRGLEVAVAVRSRVELHSSGPHGDCSSLSLD